MRTESARNERGGVKSGGDGRRRQRKDVGE
jgi:hypothetical protein